MSITPKTIASLTKQIGTLHQSIIDSAKSCLETAKEIGGMLVEIKAEMDHGDWLPWLKNLPFSDQTARNYMRIFEHRDDPKFKTVLNLADAYRLLAGESEASKRTIPQPPTRQTPPTNPAPVLEVESPESGGIEPGDENIERPAREVSLEVLPATPKGPRDDMGLEIPETCLPLWNRKPEVGNWISLVVNVRNALRGVQESDDPLFLKISPQKIIAALDNALADLRALEPYAVCKCLGKQGDKCGLCKGTGLLSHFYWKTIDEETRNMRVKMIESFNAKKH